ncbi:MAG: LVIVD repeat-containing protein [Flavisolibacter sp.]
MKQLYIFTIILFLFGCDKGTMESAAISPVGAGGSLARFTIAGNYLYTVDKENLKIYEISNGAQPVFKRSVKVGFEIETIFPFKDKLFIGSTTVVHIFSIDDPANPVKLSEAISPQVMRRCDPVVAMDSVAYATLRTNGPCGGTQSILAVFNIKDVTKPFQVNFLDLSEPYGLGYSGNTLYVCDKNQGLLVYDISKPYEPRYIKAIQDSNSNIVDIIPYQNTLVCWASDGMVLYDITDKQSPVLIKKII